MPPLAAVLRAPDPPAPSPPPPVEKPSRKKSKPEWFSVGPFTDGELAATLHPDHLVAFTDGSGTYQTSEAGSGVVILAAGIVVAEASAPIGLGSNNRAELWAIGRAVTLAGKVRPRVPVTVWSDSEWALGASNASLGWKIRDEALWTLSQQVQRAIANHGQVTLCHCPGHQKLVDGQTDAEALLVRGNSRADELAGAARKLGIARAMRRAAAAVEAAAKETERKEGALPLVAMGTPPAQKSRP